MTPYLAGRLTGFLVRPLLPVAESALAGVLDGLFGEPDALDATYTPTPDPLIDHERHVRAYEKLNGAGARFAHCDEVARTEDPPEYDGPWTLDEERLAQIRGESA